jgi:hypothetical protein
VFVVVGVLATTCVRFQVEVWKERVDEMRVVITLRYVCNPISLWRRASFISRIFLVVANCTESCFR